MQEVETTAGEADFSSLGAPGANPLERRVEG